MPERPADSRYARVLSACVLFGGIATFFAAVVMCIRFYTAAPFADTWMIIDELVMNHGRGSLALLWTQHNEHRMALAKLLMWADIFWLRGNGKSLFVETYLVQLLEALLLAWAVRSLGAWRWLETRSLLGLALFCAFCPIQYEIFVWSFGVQVAPAYALAALAFIAMACYARRPGPFPLAVSIGAAVAAPLTLAGGQVVWPLLCIAAWNLRVRARVIAGILLTWILFLGIYLIGYVRPSQHADTFASLRRPGALLQYVLLYFAGSWDALSRPLGYALATAGILTVIAWNAKAVLRRDVSPLRVAVLALASSLIANAFLTALGRLNFGLEQATTSRYQTSALLFWCCLFILCVDVLLVQAPKLVAPLTGFVLLVMLISAFHIKAPWRDAAFWSNRIKTGTPTLLADVKDDPVISANLLGTPFWIFRDTGFLRARGLSVYDTFEFRRMGVLLPSIYEVSDAGRCAGYFDKTEPVADSQWPGYRASGWGWDRTLARPIEKLVITNEAGRIVGLATGGAERADVKRVVPGVTSSFTGWHGYINGSMSWREGHAYGELPDGHTVCPIPGAPLRTQL